MIEQVGQGRMLAGLEQATGFLRWSSAVLVLASLPAFQAQAPRAQALQNPGKTRSGGSARPEDQREKDKLDQTHPQEGEANPALSHPAEAGQPMPSDFSGSLQKKLL